MAVPHKDRINDAVTVVSVASMIGRLPLIGGASIFVAITTWFNAVNQEGVKVLFTMQKEFAYIALAVGILFALLVSYFFAFQYAKIKKDNALLEFDVKYVVAFIISAIFAGAIAYAITFYGIAYISPETVITEDFLAVMLCFAIGAITAYVVDACVFHPICDGTIATLVNNDKKRILQQGLKITKDPETLKKIAAKAEALGLTDSEKVNKLSVLVSSAEDPSLATYVQILKGQK